MKKYTKPAVEIEKFTVSDIITESQTTAPEVSKPGQEDFDQLSAGLDINDEF